MKKIYSILLSAVALLSFVPVAQALDDDPPYIEGTGDAKGVAYSKRISPPSGGKYTITLESFVTGNVTVKNKSLPADIVLVLDVSGSMNDGYGDTQTYNESSTTSWNYGNTNNTFIKYEDEYYPVQRGRYDRGRYTNPRYYMFLFFTDTENNQYYLYEDRIIPATRPVTTNMNNPEYYVSGGNNNVEIYTGSLYTLGIPSKLQSLKTAVLSFIEIIDQNDLDNAPEGEERLGNQIAIVTFSGDATTEIGFTPLSSKDDLISKVRGLTANGATYANTGMELAKELLSDSESQLKTTVLFTDGIPGYYGSWTRSGDLYRTATWNVANSTINLANDIKNQAVTSTDPNEQVFSNVFTVSVITNPESYTNVYLEKTSSNYLGATNMGTYDTWDGANPYSNGNGTRNTSETDFSLSAASADELENAFATIAEASGGTSIQLDAETTSEVDVVSKSFTLPNGGDPNDIKVYVAPCTGEDDFTYTDENDEEKTGRFLTFGARTPLSITPTLGKTDPSLDKYDIIEVKGFDYSANWCGYNESTGQYQGKKLIVEIPVMMDENAVGGPDIETNAPGSGLFIKDQEEPLVEFKSPVISLPVNMHIRKEGLKVGESAKFTIQRQQKGTSTWEDVSSIFVTRHSGQAETGENAPVTKVKGLPSVTKVNNATVEYIYRVREDDWSWSYTLSRIYGTWYDAETDTSREVDMTSKGYGYSTDINQNPFIFVNTPKADIDKKVRHAESKATNTFKDGGGAAYDDSKSNGRDVITITASSSTTTEGD